MVNRSVGQCWTLQLRLVSQCEKVYGLGVLRRLISIAHMRRPLFCQFVPATVPAVPGDVVVMALPGARLQIACDPSPGATSYRFYTQRLIVDPEPVLAGGARGPLFVTAPLVPGAEYLIYVGAVNEGAESSLSEPVSAKPLLDQAA